MTAYGPNKVRQFGTTVQAKVSSIIENGEWKMPTGRRRTAEVDDFAQFLPSRQSLSRGISDIVKWLPNKSGLFSFKSTNKVLNHSTAKVYWHHLVRFKKYIPKHSFFFWLLCKNRLITKDRRRVSGASTSRRIFILTRPTDDRS